MVAHAWDDSVFLEATPLDEEDLWHVAVEPGEVKVLTLEQLDDLFRLDIIHGSTKVWQPGMSEWLPLSIVAGFEDDKAAAPPAQPARVTAGPQPAGPQPVGWGSGAPAPLRPVAPFGGSSTPYAGAPARNALAVDSLRPVVSSPIYQTQTTSRGSGAARWLLGLAAVAGLSLVLYRNDVLEDAATSSGQQATFASLESALGGPSFGTMRSIEQLSASLDLDNLKIPNALRVEETGAKDAENAAPAKAEQSESAGEAEEKKAEANSGEEAEGKNESETDASTVSLDALPKEGQQTDQALPQETPGKTTKPRAVPRRGKGGSGKNAGYSTDLGFKGSSHEYDPLNPKL